jgi:hypothetical protein
MKLDKTKVELNGFVDILGGYGKEMFLFDYKEAQNLKNDHKNQIDETTSLKNVE